MNSLFWENTLIFTGSLLLLLVVASIIVYQKQKQDTLKYRELVLRTRSWWWMIGFILFALALGRTGIICFFALLSFLALKEFYSITPIRAVDRRLVFWAYLAIPIQYYLVYISWYGLFIVFIPVYMFFLLPMRSVIIGETKGFIQSSAVIQWSLMLCVFGFSHIVYLINVYSAQSPQAGFAGLILYLLFITQFNDVSQYICGKIFGRHKIIPKVSPNKTWEGFLGGVVITTILAGGLAPFLTVMTHGEGFIAGMIIAGAGFIGDVILSSVKRDLNIKDSGALIPGHGGLLDRIDSLLYTAPLFFHYLYYIK